MFNYKIITPNNFYFKNNMDVPQDNVLLPLLSNICLHELDFFMNNLIKKYYKGKFPTVNPKYYKKLKLKRCEKTLTNEMQKLIKKRKCRLLLNEEIKPYYQDRDYIRIKYIRYADDFLVGMRARAKKRRVIV